MVLTWLVRVSKVDGFLEDHYSLDFLMIPVFIFTSSISLLASYLYMRKVETSDSEAAPVL